MLSILLIILVVSLSSLFSYAAASDNEKSIAAETVNEGVSENEQSNLARFKAIAAAIAIGVTAAAGAISMGLAISKALESISRQPEAQGEIRGSLLLGLVFVETTIIYALVIAILIIFVL